MGYFCASSRFLYHLSARHREQYTAAPYVMYMATAVRLNAYLSPGYLIEYSTPRERQIGIVLEIHWVQRYGLSTIYVLSSESGCKMIYVKDVCVVY